MKPKGALEALEPLLRQPVFSASEARARGMSSAALNYYIRLGKIERMRRGVYRSVDAPRAEHTQWDDLVEAVLSLPGSTICLYSALAIHELTDEIPRRHFIAVRHGTSAKVRRPVKLIRFRDVELGRTTVKLGGISVPIFDRERCIVDAFRRLPLDVAIKALKAGLARRGADKLNLVVLESYSKRLRIRLSHYVISLAN